LFAGGTGIGLLRVSRTLGALAHGALLDKVGRSRCELALELQLPRMRRVQLSLKFVGGCDSFASCSVGLGGPPLRRTLGLRTGRPLALQFHRDSAICGVSALNGCSNLLCSLGALGGQFRLQLLNAQMGGGQGSANLINARFLGCMVA
jgi:hypothetical protein